jgi:uncharacterized protein (DUF1778 family)
MAFDMYGENTYTGFRINGHLMPQERHRTARIEARIAPDVLVIVRRAAEIQGRSVSDFSVAAAQEAALRTIAETEIIRLSVEDQRRIAGAILDPPEPTPALRKAFRRHRELFGTE